MRKLGVILGLFWLCVPIAASAATCDAGQYLLNGECTSCPLYSYCPGDDINHPCPDPVTHARTTFPEKYYNPTITRTYLFNDPAAGAKKLESCREISYMLSERGGLYEYAYYNPDTEKYDITIEPYWGWGWGIDVAAGYYLTTPAACGASAYYHEAKECLAGYFCPGKKEVACNESNKAIVHTETFGLEICPAGHYCPAGASAPTPCPAGTYSDTTGASVCKACTNAPDNTHYTGGGNANDCPWECDDGYGLHDGACVPLCDGGMRYIKTSNGLQFNLYPVAYSTPALHVKRGDTVCHAVLVPGAAANAININHNGQIYHTVD